MPSIMPTGKQQFTNNAGVPLAGGKVYTFEAGTTTPKATYQDAGGTVESSNPIVLNARGEALAFWHGAYDVKVTDANGLTIYTVPNYQAPVMPDDLSADDGTDKIGGTWFAGAQSKLSDLATQTGSSLLGFVHDGTGAAPRSIQSKLRDIVCPEDFGAKGDGTTDDAAAIQNAINSFANGSSCSLRLCPGKTYLIKKSISTNNRSIVIDGHNATLLVGASMTYGLQLVGTNCELRNLQVKRSDGATVTAGIYITGLQHVVRNVTSRDQKWPVFILAQDMKESHIANLRVDNDVTNNTGIVIQFDYCVNNTVSNSMVGFCAQAFYGSGSGQPTSGYHSEGILFSSIITVYAGKAVNFDNGTFIAISNCCLDFCETQGVFMSNGTDLNVSNTWIASNLTGGFIGIGTLPAVEGVSVQNNTFVRGAAAITGTAGVSLPGPSALVIGNRFRQGMNGGVVTQATSQVGLNSVTGGGTNIIANNSVSTVVGSMSIEKNLAFPPGGSLKIGDTEGIYPIALSGSATAGSNGPVPTAVAGYAGVVIEGELCMLPYFKP